MEDLQQYLEYQFTSHDNRISNSTVIPKTCTLIIYAHFILGQSYRIFSNHSHVATSGQPMQLSQNTTTQKCDFEHLAKINYWTLIFEDCT